ncbi:MAG: sigma-70 family RNA polymerase sigma factor [Terracoccus sp.]
MRGNAGRADGAVPESAGSHGPVDPLGVSPARPRGRLGELLRRAGLGDEAAFAELYDVAAPRVYGLVRRIVVDPERSEDVTCEVFLQIWRTAARFDGSRCTALGWMVSLAHRTAVERVRSVDAAGTRGRAPSPSPSLDAESTTDPVFVADLPSSSPAAERLGQAWAALSTDTRGALDLAYFGGHTHAEVGDILGLPVGTAQVTLRDGLGELGRNLHHRP